MTGSTPMLGALVWVVALALGRLAALAAEE
jgi:hypothetical protein